MAEAVPGTGRVEDNEVVVATEPTAPGALAPVAPGDETDNPEASEPVADPDEADPEEANPEADCPDEAVPEAARPEVLDIEDGPPLIAVC